MPVPSSVILQGRTAVPFVWARTSLVTTTSARLFFPAILSLPVEFIAASVKKKKNTNVICAMLDVNRDARGRGVNSLIRVFYSHLENSFCILA